MVSTQVAALLRGGIKPRRRPPHLEHHLLGDLLRLRGIAQHPADDAIGGPGKLPVQQLKRLLVADRGEAQQLVEVLLAFRT